MTNLAVPSIRAVLSGRMHILNLVGIPTGGAQAEPFGS
jgi:hypothetical protein